MDSTDLKAVQRAARFRYEWSRTWRALLGFSPAVVLVIMAAWLSQRTASALAFGSLMFAIGALLLWYGRGLNRAVLPGLLAGLLPLSSALCANHMGHVCTGGACVSLCLPACIVGGVGAGLFVAFLARSKGRGVRFLLAASTLALLTGAMGCGCIGFSGVIGLAGGYLVGVIPNARKLLTSST